MSGDIRVESLVDESGSLKPLAAHDRLLLLFEDGLRLVFNDPRKFGRVWLVSDPSEVLGRLGPEPLDPPSPPDELACPFEWPPAQSKTAAAGPNNCGRAWQHLYRRSAAPGQNSPIDAGGSAYPSSQIENLWLAIRSVLQEGIRRNGASIDWVYRGGDFQNHFRAYGRGGQPCPVCGTPIEKMVVGQRGTHYCPFCQPVPTGERG